MDLIILLLLLQKQKDDPNFETFLLFPYQLNRWLLKRLNHQNKILRETKNTIQTRSLRLTGTFNILIIDAPKTLPGTST